MSESNETHTKAGSTKFSRFFTPFIQWFDSDYCPEGASKVRNEPDKVDWTRVMPFVALHLGCLGAIWVGVSPVALISAVALYFIRMFAVTEIGRAHV